MTALSSSIKPLTILILNTTFLSSLNSKIIAPASNFNPLMIIRKLTELKTPSYSCKTKKSSTSSMNNITPPPNSRTLPLKNYFFPFKTIKILKKSVNLFRIRSLKDKIITSPLLVHFHNSIQRFKKRPQSLFLNKKWLKLKNKWNSKSENWTKKIKNFSAK